MSLLSPEKLRIALRPDAVAVTAVQPFRRRAVLRGVWACEPQPRPVVSWQACIDTLAAELSLKPRGYAVAVVLSNLYCQFAIVSRPSGLSNAAEARAYVRNRVEAIHGEAGRDWDLELSAAGNDAWLVCCTPRALLEAIRGVFAAKRAAVHSIQPYFATAWNRRPRSVHGKNGWFVVQEPKYLVTGLVSKGGWAHLAARRSGETLDDVLDVLDRERELSGGEGIERNVWLYGSALERAPGEYRGYRLSVVAPPRASEIDIAKRPLYAMAA